MLQLFVRTVLETLLATRSILTIQLNLVGKGKVCSDARDYQTTADNQLKSNTSEENLSNWLSPP